MPTHPEADRELSDGTTWLYSNDGVDLASDGSGAVHQARSGMMG